MTNRSEKGQFIKGHEQLNSGRTHFKNNHITWNKGTKGIMKTNKTSFKKGHRAGIRTCFKKGQSPWIEGKKHILESRRKMSESHKGKSTWNKGKLTSAETKKKQRYSAIKRIEKQHFDGFQLVPCVGSSESKMINLLENLFEYKINRQYKVAGYFLDGYCLPLNLAIEVDEKYHDSERFSKRDEERQKVIENELNCQFLRIKVMI